MTDQQIRHRDLFRLDGRIAIVTGGTRGIGRSIAEGFVDAGASVVVASRDAASVDETVESLQARGGRAAGVSADIGNLDDVQRIVDGAVAAFGGIDIVVNNAATTQFEAPGALTPESWSTLHDVNLRGPVFLIERAIPYLTKSQHASVVNVLSIAAYGAVPHIATYGATKAALLSFTRSMAAGLAPNGIRVNAIAPGVVATDMVKHATEADREAMGAASFLKRVAEPEEMIGPALFLAADASSFVTGQVIIADGGIVAPR